MDKQIKIPIQNSTNHIVVDICTDNPTVVIWTFLR